MASMGDPHAFKSGRGYAASLGITPATTLERRQGASRSDHAPRRWIFADAVGTRSARIPARRDKKTDGKSAWARRLKERRHVNVAAVALAAKHARIAGRYSPMAQRGLCERTQGESIYLANEMG